MKSKAVKERRRNRAVERQAARDRDERRLARGEASSEELRREKSMFAGSTESALRSCVDAEPASAESVQSL